jgi:glycosyltransferase involved in cell wall biosynthesis
MNPAGPASVVVASYNDLAILPATLAAFARQSFRDFELILADDGSREDYGPTLKEWAPRVAQGIQHVKQQDRGFRRARILNRAIYVSRFDRLIFVDTDCLPHHHFVENHLRYLTPGTVITGRRVHLERSAIPAPSEILARGLRLGPGRLLMLWMRGKARVIEHGFVSPVLYESSADRILGSNFSASKSDLQGVNGFNEQFEGWGFEDGDLEFRLKLNGVRFRNLRNKVIQYHLRHAQRSEPDAHNREILERTMARRAPRAAVGLDEITPGEFTCARYGAATADVASG